MGSDPDEAGLDYLHPPAATLNPDPMDGATLDGTSGDEATLDGTSGDGGRPPALAELPGDEESRAQRLVELLTSAGARYGQLVHTHHIPAREGVSVPWPEWVNPAVVQAWKSRGVPSPWRHQAKALDAIHAGHDVVVATGTGSGKSLAAWTPILSDLAHSDTSNRISDIHRRPTCIYLSPTKALAADQFAALQRLVADSDLRVQASTADGDTPREAKEWARAHADIILTNPDFLHFVLLPGHERWTRMLASLSYIVIDELHHWRGVTGSHISLVIRRLLRAAQRLGADPKVIMLSATVREPERVGAAMIGRSPVRAITDDTSPAGQRFVMLWKPREMVDESAISIDSFLGALAGEIPVLEAPLKRVSATTEASFLLSDIVAAGGRALAFVRSRAAAEALAAQVRDRLSSAGNPLAGRVGAYRGGYLPEERRALEAALRQGEIRALATTSALELGIDVSGLDVTVTAGWPGTRASLWQQIGRAGRAGATGVSVFIASDDPLDSYIATHPEHLTAPVESATIDPDNPWVLAPHLAAAAAEFPLVTNDSRYFGPQMISVISRLTQQGFLRERPSSWASAASLKSKTPLAPTPLEPPTTSVSEEKEPPASSPIRSEQPPIFGTAPAREWRWDFTRPERPSDLTDLRGSGGDVQIIDADSRVVIGSVPDADADAQVFPDAIYVHQGLTYHVLSLAPVTPGSTQRVAQVERVSTSLRTRAKARTHVRIVDIEESRTSSDGMVTWHCGRVEVTSQVTDFDLLRLPGLEFLRNRELHLPERHLPTKAVWYTLNSGIFSRLGIAPADIPGALHASEHASIGILPLLATCDRWDLGGLSCPDHEQTNAPTVFVYDAYQGGAGHADYGFAHVGQWMSTTLDAVRECPCESGCPSCVQSPKCGNGNEPLDKHAATALLSFLSAQA